MSVKVEAGVPWAATAARNAASTIGPVTRRSALTRNASREWSSSRVRTSVPVPSASGWWVKSACQHSFGCSAWKRSYDQPGPLGWLGGHQPGAGQIPAEDSHFEGADGAQRLLDAWLSLAGHIDPVRFEQVRGRFELQLANAAQWRDVVNSYFFRKSGIPDELGREIY